MADGTRVTQLLRQFTSGRDAAMDELVPVVYDELRRLARHQLRSERSDHTLGPTALVHEAYIRLVDVREVDWQDRAHFFAMAARQMRRVLIDHARSRGRLKRGGEAVKLPLSEALHVDARDSEELIALDDALLRLEAINERLCRVVECRCFAGLTVEETARALDISTATVKRDLAFSRAWLNRALHEDATEVSDE